MTTTSAKQAALIDFSAFRLDDEALRSLHALADGWVSAVYAVFGHDIRDPALIEFVRAVVDLPSHVLDPAWQERWLCACQHMLADGFSLSELLQFLSAVNEACEADLLGDGSRVGRPVCELYSILRRCIFAAVSCAIEIQDALRQEEAGLPGEIEALRCVHELRRDGRPLAVLSLSLSNRNSFARMLASDLQSLPGLLADRLAAMLRPDDRVFLGRESEWLLVLPDVHSMAQPTLAAAHVQRAFAGPIRLLSGHSLMLDSAIGAAISPEHGGEPETVVHAARLARWELASTHQAFGWYHDGLNEDWEQRYELLGELRDALHHETLGFVVQPQIEADTGACVGAELLLRWQRHNGAWVPPQLVIDMIEENGWRVFFTDFLIRYAMRTSADLAAAGVDVSLSFNLTAADLLDPDLPEMIGQRLETWQLDGRRFTLELTESAMLGDRTRCLENMDKLRALGLRLAIDDFGTGYSSLSYLVSLPINEVKIDRSFVIAMENSPEQLRVVRTIIDLARDLEMMPLAEGVETPQQCALLQRLGCQRMQGYLYGRPMPVADFVVWYQSRQT